MSDQTTLSFEFYAPKTPQGREKLLQVRRELQVFNPDFYSVTYGAGGSTRDTTKDVVTAIHREGVQVAPHLSFGGDTEETILQLLGDYQALGIKRIVALRGDAPSGTGGAAQLVYANQLVSFVRQHFGQHFHIEVAAYPEIHPQAINFDSDIRYLKGKFDAGADSAITQYFYNPDAYFYFVEACAAAGISQPIVPGIMPIINYRTLARFSENCGAEIPRWVCKRLEAFGDDSESLKAFGVDLVAELCLTLLENGAPGLHFYTMNQSETVSEIVTAIGLDAEHKD